MFLVCNQCLLIPNKNSSLYKTNIWIPCLSTHKLFLVRIPDFRSFHIPCCCSVLLFSYSFCIPCCCYVLSVCSFLYIPCCCSVLLFFLYYSLLFIFPAASMSCCSPFLTVLPASALFLSPILFISPAAALSSCSCFSVPVFSCSCFPVFLFLCSCFQLFLFSSVPVFSCSHFPVFLFSSAPVCLFLISIVPVFQFLVFLFLFSDAPVNQCSCFSVPVFRCSCFTVPVSLCFFSRCSCFPLFLFSSVPVFQSSCSSVSAVRTLRPVGLGCVDGTKTVASWSYLWEKTGYSLVHSDIQVCTYHTRQNWNARDTKVSSIKTVKEIGLDCSRFCSL